MTIVVIPGLPSIWAMASAQGSVTVGARWNPFTERSMQACVLCLGLFQDRDLGIGVFPKSKEILICGECPDARGIGIRTLWL